MKIGNVFLMVVAMAVCAGATSAPNAEAQSWVAEAVSWGASQKKLELPKAKGSPSVRYSTPYLRVAMAAHKARRDGSELNPASVPEYLTAPELHLFIQMLPVGNGGRLVGMAPVAGVTLVVAGQRLKPSSLDTVAQLMSAGVPGGETHKFDGRELRASFALRQPIPPEVQAVVEYSWAENEEPQHVERTYRLDLQKTKW
jgi:hypothetical protein